LFKDQVLDIELLSSGGLKKISHRQTWPHLDPSNSAALGRSCGCSYLKIILVSLLVKEFYQVILMSSRPQLSIIGCGFRGCKTLQNIADKLPDDLPRGFVTAAPAMLNPNSKSLIDAADLIFLVSSTDSPEEIALTVELESFAFKRERLVVRVDVSGGGAHNTATGLSSAVVNFPSESLIDHSPMLLELVQAIHGLLRSDCIECSDFADLRMFFKNNAMVEFAMMGISGTKLMDKRAEIGIADSYLIHLSTSEPSLAKLADVFLELGDGLSRNSNILLGMSENENLKEKVQILVLSSSVSS
jgi:hypothetical protein